MIKHNSPISCISNFKDEYIVTGGYDNKIILYTAKKREAISVGFHDHLVNDCNFDETGKLLLTSSSDYSSRLWSIPELRLLAVFRHHLDDVTSSIFIPNTDLIASASRDNKINIYQRNGNLIRSLVGHDADVISIDWQSNTKKLLSSSDDGCIKVWDIDEGACIKTIDFKGIETDVVKCLGKHIFCGNDSGELIGLNSETFEIVSKFKCHESGIKSISVDQQQKILLTCSYDYKFKLWEYSESTLLKSLFEEDCPKINWMNSSCILDDQNIGFGTFGSKFSVFNTRNKKWDLTEIEQTYGINKIKAYDSTIYTVGDSGELLRNGMKLNNLGTLLNTLEKIGDSIVCAGQDGAIYDVQKNEVIHKHKSPINCSISMNLNNKSYMLFGTYTGEILVFLYENGRFLFLKEIKVFQNAIKDLIFGTEFIFIVCANTDSAFLTAQNFELVRYINNSHSKIPNAVCHLGDDVFISTGRDLCLHFWSNLDKKNKILTPHKHSIKCMYFEPASSIVITGSYNGTIAKYNLKTKKWISKRLTNSGISSICYCESEKRFIASSYDGKTYKINN